MRPARRARYTDAEDEVITATIDDPIVAVAARLGRPASSVSMRRTRLRRMGRIPPAVMSRFTAADDRIVIETMGQPLSVAARLLGRDPSSIFRRRRLLRQR